MITRRAAIITGAPLADLHTIQLHVQWSLTENKAIAIYFSFMVLPFLPFLSFPSPPFLRSLPLPPLIHLGVL